MHQKDSGTTSNKVFVNLTACMLLIVQLLCLVVANYVRPANQQAAVLPV